MLLFTDLETTGLDPYSHEILEVAWTITHDDLSTHLEGIHAAVVSLPDLLPDNMEDVVIDMHTHTGLLKEVLNGEGVTLGEIERQMLQDINAGVSDAEPLMLAGLGVHFDKAFIKNHMPQLWARLHYRIFEVSTLKRFFALNGIVDEERNPMPHRAAYDVQEALNNARFYRDRVAHLLELEKIVKDA